jgi:hypothetical protein
MLEALAVRAHDLLHHRLVAEIAADGIDLESLAAQALGRLLELLRRAATVSA